MVLDVAELADCPECGSAGSVDRGLCQVCYAELDEAGAADLPPAASTTSAEALVRRDREAPVRKFTGRSPSVPGPVTSLP